MTRQSPGASRTERTWRGRVLPRADEDLEDQGLTFDVETLLGRRVIFRAAGVGALGFGLAACGAATNGTTSSADGTAMATATGEIPDETAGPYPADGSNGADALAESGIVRSDIRSSFGDTTTTAEGVPMTLELTLSDLADGGSAFAGQAVYV